jgi:hypothetical protein
LSTKIKNHEKDLSNKKSVEILYIIGSSEKPLTPREIEEQWFDNFKIQNLPSHKKKDSDVYRVIYQLTGFSISKKLMLFYLDEIEEKCDNNFQLKLLKKTNKLFYLGLSKKNIDSIIQKLEVERKKKDSSEIFSFSYTKNKDKNLSITIEINKKEQKGSIITKGQFNNKRILELKRKSDRIIVSAKIHYNRERVNFLKYIIQDDKQKKIDKLQQSRKLFPELSLLNERGTDYVFIEDMTKDESENIKEISNIQYNVANYAYCLSFKGFLLYLQNERNESRINKVIDSLVKNQYTRGDYAFLGHPDSLDKILGKNIRIEILKLITSWFSARLYYNGISEEELKHFVGSFYFWILHNKILEKDKLIADLIRDQIGNKDFVKLKDYRIYILRKIISYQEQELSYSKEELKRIENEGIFPPSFVH